MTFADGGERPPAPRGPGLDAEQVASAGGLLPVPELVGVIGGGRMGSGIAHAFLLAGASVVVVEADGERGALAHSSIERALRRSAELGGLAPPVEQVLARAAVTTDAADVSAAGLVIEAVPEDLRLKHTVLQRVCSLVGDDAVIATNTSSLSIGQLAEAVTVPGRFIGMHFFSPVPVSQLVEVVLGPGTSEETAAAAQRWVRAVGKEPVTVADSPGFASSRLGVLLGLEAIRMVEEGVARVEDIDAAMTLGYQHPVGPLRLTDLVGLDVRLGVADYLAGELGPRFEPPQLLRDMVARGECGRKSGRGFYRWPERR